MVDGCIFCKIAESSDKKIIYENNNFFSILDIEPKVSGHGLIISKKHFKTILDMPSTLGSELLDCIKKTSLNLMKSENAEGFNVVNNSFSCAGQIVNHFHLHVLPRKQGDGFRISC